jgi:hypothetical protein
MPANTDLDICSRALVQLGEEPITSFNQETAASRVAALMYESTVEDLFGLHRWHFATRTTQLSRLAAEPDIDWDAEYVLPEDCLVVKRLRVDDVPVEFELHENTVRCNATEEEEVYLTYVARINEAYWPPYFRALVEKELMARFAFPVTAQETVAAEARRGANAQLRSAKLLDAQSQTTRPIRQSRFLAAR